MLMLPKEIPLAKMRRVAQILLLHVLSKSFRKILSSHRGICLRGIVRVSYVLKKLGSIVLLWSAVTTNYWYISSKFHMFHQNGSEKS